MIPVNGGLKDIFNTILNDQVQGKNPQQTTPQKIVVHGNGNVIAPGGTVHMTTSSQAHAGPAHGEARGA